ncbi:MAG: ParB/RepB/Spo0J family partition protein [Limnochordia bacterium]|jgi:ParB family chromosome partitioning protein|nr:ParB/RepB/Spo0J family partition protein [Limnochordia bacterium]
MKVMSVPIKMIEIPPRQIRRRASQEGIKTLADSIAEVGLLHPITVRPLKGDMYRLIAGERRFQACKLLGFEYIECIIADQTIDATRFQLVENEQRSELDPLERAVCIMQYLNETGLSKNALAEKIGIPRTTMLNWLLILEASERHQRAIVNNFQGGTSVLTLSHLAVAKRTARRLKKDQLQDQLLDLAEEQQLARSDLEKASRLLIENRKLTPMEAIRRVRPVEKFRQPRLQEQNPRLASEQASVISKINEALDEAGRYFHQLDQGPRIVLKEQERQVLTTKLREIEELALDLAAVLSSTRD